MGLLSFVAIDLETTGLDPTEDEIVEIGAVRFDEGQETDSLAQLIAPDRPLPLRVQHLTGITPAALAGKPKLADVLPALRDFIGDRPLVAHNAGFEAGFLRAAFSRAGMGLPNSFYDTVELARVVLPMARSHRLEALVNQLNLQVERHHRAEDDARACGRLLLALAEKIRQMDLGLLRFILNVGEPAGWPLAPLFRSAYDAKEAAGQKPTPLTEWIRPYEGQLHRPDEAEVEENPAPLPARLGEELLGPGGVVAEAFSAYEHRPQQLQMAEAVTQAFNQGRHLLVEAGTGTGKSLAYLIPAIAWARQNHEKVAISTYTINLQEQLWNKDIPFLQEALQGTALAGFSAALVKGRSNLICLRKWEEAATGADFLTSLEERVFHMRLASWLAKTQTGDKSELNLSFEQERWWQQVQSESETCLGPKCRWFRNHCFAFRARRQARDADILVLNHAMLMADINTGNELLPPFRHLVVDEAHHLEAVATQNLGVRLENWDVTSALLHLYRSAGQGMLPVLRRRVLDGRRIPARPPVGLPSEDHVERLIDLTLACRSGVDELFGLCAQIVDAYGRGEEETTRSLRLTEAVRSGPLWESLDAARANAAARLRQLSQGLLALGEALEELDPPIRDVERTVIDIQKQSGILYQSAKAMDQVLLQPGEGDVTWIEASGRRESPRIVLRSAPINVGDVLRERLFERLRSVVMTSATLAVNGGFEHLKQRLGLAGLPPDRLTSGVVTSPFAYRRQALLCVADDMPSPRDVTDREFTQAVEGFLRSYLVKAGGRTLVLFTSHRQLRQVYGDLKDDLEGEGLCLLGQGLDGSRGRLVEEFRDDSRSILFGSASFWEGVDIPGDGLTSVIMVRLPFMPPDDPVMEARIEDLERRGISSFGNLSLPQAIIRFKQGFGRLVRTGTDRGVVIVLDSRLSPGRSRYGRQFLRSLPGPSTFVGPQEQVIERALAWLKLEDAT